MSTQKSEIEVEVLDGSSPLEEDTEQPTDETDTEVNEEDGPFTVNPPPPGKEDEYATFIPRGLWQANPEVCPEAIPLNSPPVTSLVATWTDTDTCTTETECQQRVRQIQEAHIMFRKLPDIKYHYLIGGDGCVYEGRGWHKKGEPYPPQIGLDAADILNKQHVEIAFIDRCLKPPNQKQLEVLSTIITLGQEDNWLTTSFRFYWSVGDHVEFFKIYDASDELQSMLPPSQPEP